MSDILYIALLIIFFTASYLLAKGLDRLSLEE